MHTSRDNGVQGRGNLRSPYPACSGPSRPLRIFGCAQSFCQPSSSLLVPQLQSFGVSVSQTLARPSHWSVELAREKGEGCFLT